MSTHALGSYTAVTHSGFHGATEPEPPSLENHFNLDVGDEYSSHAYVNVNIDPDSTPVLIWKNSYLKQVITPYIPSADDKEFIAACEKAFTKTKRGLVALTPAESIFMTRDFAKLVLSPLDESLRCMISLSSVNKCTYVIVKEHLASKPDTYWGTQLSKRLPHVQFLSSNLCSLSPRQQFEIINYRLKAEGKPYIAKYVQNQRTCKIVKENLDKIAAEEKGKDEQNYGLDPNPIFAPLYYEGTFQTGVFRSFAYQWNCSMLFSIDAEVYNPITRASTFLVATGSKQSQLQRAIKILIPQAFNQTKFEEVIQQSETLRNTTSASSNVMAIESENVDNEPEGMESAFSDHDDENSKPHTQISLDQLNIVGNCELNDDF